MTRPTPPPPAPDDRQAMDDLVRRVAREADRLAFAELFEHFAPRIKGFMLRGRLAEGLAEEIVQETMITVWRKAALFDAGKASVSTWIFTIARNKRIDLLRKQNRPEPDYNDPMFQPDPEPTGEQTLALTELRENVREAVQTLPEAQMQVVQLSYFEGLTQAEIAVRLNIPLGTVKSRLRLALQKVRQLTGDEL